MLVMTIVQRGVGFFRGIWLCRLMDDAAVGQWSMALGFITMATPLMMLGLPGAMPRYVERYRLAGQLPRFIARVIVGTLVGSVIAISVVMVAPQWVGWLIFRDVASGSLVGCIAIALVAVLVFNFVNELVSSLRQVRTVSVMQFIQGVGFTILGLGVLYGGGGLPEVILAYAASSVLATIPGAYVIARDWSGLPTSELTFDAPMMWKSLLPYAAALWMMNLLTNSFELSDRYMILHWTPGGETIASAAVGQYHSGRLIPTLLTSLAMMLGGVLMPYLSADWEAGRTDAVQQRLGQVLYWMAFTFTACAAITIGLSPLIFSTLLQGRYSDGLAIQPMAFAFCIWGATVTVAQSYLWVRERGGLMAVALIAGLVVNAALNFAWLPVYGLAGAVAATLVSNGIVMLVTGMMMARAGYRLDANLVWVAVLPLALVIDWRIAIAVSIASLLLHREAYGWTREAVETIGARMTNRSSATAARVPS